VAVPLIVNVAIFVPEVRLLEIDVVPVLSTVPVVSGKV
jgi:hypothetical protein